MRGIYRWKGVFITFINTVRKLYKITQVKQTGAFA